MRQVKVKEVEEIPNVPTVPGRYWLYEKVQHTHQVIYHGISKTNLRRRLMQQRLVKQFDAFFFEEGNSATVRNEENRLLLAYKQGMGSLPRLNRIT